MPEFVHRFFNGCFKITAEERFTCCMTAEKKYQDKKQTATSVLYRE
jgi:hypothetical protein